MASAYRGQIRPGDAGTHVARSNRPRRLVSGPWARSTRPLRAALILVLAVAASCGRDTTGPERETPVPCLSPYARCTERISIGDDAFLPVYRTHPLTEGDTSVTRAVVVIHGTNRNADDYFDRMITAVRSIDGTAETVVVAPRFQTADDLPAGDEPYWTSGGWKRGDLSRSSSTPEVSSYAALDRILEILTDRERFPRVTRVVVTGHSAGGQVTHRFAAGSRTEDEIDAAISVRYVVANPSTYLYLRPERARADSFVVPGPTCLDYDDWHYGMQNLNTFMNARDTAATRVRLTTRDVIILVGDADTGTSLLDQSCGANLQGANRYERGRTLARFMDAFFPDNGHLLRVVPGVGHSSSAVYTSDVGRAALFEP